MPLPYSITAPHYTHIADEHMMTILCCATHCLDFCVFLYVALSSSSSSSSGSSSISQRLQQTIKVKVKVKVKVYRPDIPCRFSRLYINYSQVLELTLSVSSPSTAVAIHQAPIFIQPATHCCWVDRGCVDWKLTQGTWPVLQETQTHGSRVQRLNHSATHSTEL